MFSKSLTAVAFVMVSLVSMSAHAATATTFWQPSSGTVKAFSFELYFDDVPENYDFAIFDVADFNAGSSVATALILTTDTNFAGQVTLDEVGIDYTATSGSVSITLFGDNQFVFAIAEAGTSSWVLPDWFDSFDGGYVLVFDSAAIEVGLTNVSPVPVPAALWLFGSGLIGLVAVARRKETV